MKTIRLTDKYEASDESECWPWHGSIDRHQGYGTWSDRGKNRKAHRVVYEAIVGPIPEGLTLDHLCRNRACVNPKHLEIVTSQENTLRGMGLAALNARKTECYRGHSFDVANTHITPRGYRDCKKCHRDWNRKDQARRKAAQ